METVAITLATLVAAFVLIAVLGAVAAFITAAFSH